ncbi:hypothetical protein WME94_16855 [Sorangium sp. So ce429]
MLDTGGQRLDGDVMTRRGRRQPEPAQDLQIELPRDSDVCDPAELVPLVELRAGVVIELEAEPGVEAVHAAAPVEADLVRDKLLGACPSKPVGLPLVLEVVLEAHVLLEPDGGPLYGRADPVRRLLIVVVGEPDACGARRGNAAP